MPFSNAQLDADLEAMRTDLPVNVTNGAETRSCTPTGIRTDLVFAAEGARDAYTMSVTLVVSDWTTLPETDDTVTIDSVDYYVLHHEDGAAGRSRRLDLAEEYAVI